MRFTAWLADLFRDDDPPIPRPREREPASPWLDIGFRDGLEWFRDHPRASDALEYEDWSRWEYIPKLLGGIGGDPDARAGQLTPRQREAVQSATVGLAKAHDLHRRRTTAGATAGLIPRPDSRPPHETESTP